MDISFLTHILAPVVAASGDGDAAAAAPLVLALSGFIFYGIMYSRYRNADKRHTHERETKADIANLACTDAFVQSRKGLRNASLNGANHSRVEGALNVGSAKKLLGFIKM